MLWLKTTDSKIAVHADFRETLAKAKGTADLILTSPPYDDARTYGADVSWTMDDYRALGDACFAALKPGGWVLMVLGGAVNKTREGMGSERSLTPWRTLIDWADRVGFRCPDQLVYFRPGVPGKFSRRFRCDHEPLLWFQRPPADLGYFEKDAVSKRRAESRALSKGTVRLRDGTNQAKCFKPADDVLQGTVWVANGFGAADEGAETDHPARYSLPFACDVVRCFCPPDGLVVDPFVGSGTTAVAAVRCGRKFLGGDLLADKRGKPWSQWAHKRVQAELRKRGRSFGANLRGEKQA